MFSLDAKSSERSAGYTTPALRSEDSASRLTTRLATWCAGLCVTVLALWLSGDQGIHAGPSEYDDEWFLRTAESWYWFAPGYSRLSFLKEAPYPLFVAVTYRLGLPLRLAHEVIYLAAAGFLAWTLMYRQTRSWVALVVYAAIAFLPAHFYMFERATHDTLYSALLMLAGGALLLQVKRRGKPGWWLCWVATGLALGLLWNTRQERSLVVVFVLPFLVASLLAEWNHAANTGRALLRWLLEWAPPAALVALMTFMFMYANYCRWGVFAVSNISSPKLQAAYRALLSIKPDRPLSYVPITRDMREKAYSVSPSFRELQPSLEGHLLHWHDAWNSYQDIPENEYSGGFFLLLFRQAVKEAGHYQSATETESYYGRIAEELNTAAAEGRLRTRTLPPGVGWAVHPDLETYAHRLWPSWRSVWYHCWSEKGPTEPFADAPATTPEIKALFDRVACRRVTHYPGTTRQTQVRDWLWAVYNRGAEMALAAGMALAGLVIVFWRPPGWAWYVLPAFAFGGYGFVRMTVFTIIDASTLCGSEMRYYFPQALALTITAAWLLVGGAYLTISFRSTAGRMTIGSLIVGVLFVLAGALLWIQLSYGKWAPPDYTPVAGVLELVDDNEISGWARLKEAPGPPVEVDIYVDDVRLTSVTANEFRQDLLDRHIGSGRHGFRISTPRFLKDGKPHAIGARIAGTNYRMGYATSVTLTTTADRE